MTRERDLADACAHLMTEIRWEAVLDPRMNCRCVLNPVWGDGDPLTDNEQRRVNGLTRYRLDGGPWLDAEVIE